MSKSLKSVSINQIEQAFSKVLADLVDPSAAVTINSLAFVAVLAGEETATLQITIKLGDALDDEGEF